MKEGRVHLVELIDLCLVSPLATNSFCPASCLATSPPVAVQAQDAHEFVEGLVELKIGVGLGIDSGKGVGGRARGKVNK